MKKLVFIIAVYLGIFILDILNVSAENYGELIYEVVDGEIIIIGCNTSATEIKIPNTIAGYTVTKIGESAFADCTNLVSITIPDSITDIGYIAFFYCTNLMDINVGKNNSNYSSEDGVLFNKDKTELIQYPCGKKDYLYLIPNSVTKISDSAFYCCKGLTSVDIPDNVVEIGYEAFCGCANLSDITISDNVKNIGFRAFYNTKYYNKSANWENNVLHLGKCLLEVKKSVSGSYTIKEGVVTIASSAFMDCSKLTSVVIPDSVRYIGHDAFMGCYGLTDMMLPDSVVYIGDYAFYDCDKLINIKIPDSLTYVSNGMFSNCSRLKSVIIPNSVKCVGERAFEMCDELINISIPKGVTYIGKEAFSWCTNLTSVELHTGVTRVEKDAFNWCYRLKDIYYYGSQEDWSKILISTGNNDFENATIYFVPYLQIDTSDDGEFLYVTAMNVANGSAIILALYNEDEFLELQPVLYEGERVSFAITENYTEAKIMVWDSFASMKPITNVELIVNNL